MTITLATQYNFTGTYTLKVDPRGRISFPRDIIRGLEEKVLAIVIADQELKMNQYGVEYMGQWLYVTREDTSGRRRIRDFFEEIRKADPEAPSVVYKTALLENNMLIDPKLESRDIVTKHWKYTFEGEEVEYMTITLNLARIIEDIKNRTEKKSEPERIREDMYSSSQRYTIDDLGRICMGKNHEIVRKTLATKGRELMLLGMGDMLVLMTPEQREALQRGEPRFLREGRLVHLIGS